jgi:hypothetical protein
VTLCSLHNIQGTKRKGDTDRGTGSALCEGRTPGTASRLPQAQG